MTGLAIATGVLAVVFYVALRRVRPSGIALDPWPYLMRFDSRTRWERMLPDGPDAPICDVEPPAELLRGLLAFGFTGMTRCYQQPHPLGLPRVAHTGYLLADGKDPGDELASQSYTWIVDRQVERQAATFRRRAWWRRALIRFATRLATS